METRIPLKGPVMRNYYILFVDNIKQLLKQLSSCQWCAMVRCNYKIISRGIYVIYLQISFIHMFESLNMKKRIIYVFQQKNKIQPDISLNIDGQVIAEFTLSKFLGVSIDNKLNWRDHVSFVCRKFARGLGIIIKARKVLQKESLIPKFLNCENIFKYLVGRLMYRVYHGEFRTLQFLFVRNSDIHKHDTRQRGHYHIPVCRTNLGKSSLRYFGACLLEQNC